MTAEKKIEYVICAVRGGPESRDTVTRAIDLAVENQARLSFFHVIDVEFLEHATIGPLSVVYKELEEMSRFAMLILQDRARRRGIEQVDFKIAEGDLWKQLLAYTAKSSADVIVLGKPTRSPGRNMFTAEKFEEFVRVLEGHGDHTVIQVTPSPPS